MLYCIACVTKLTSIQRRALHYVARYETAVFGVIVRHVTGAALVERGYLTETNQRRRFSRDTGICVRLTLKGIDWTKANG